MLISKYLKPALLYKQEIEDKVKEKIYTDELFYYEGAPGYSLPNIHTEDYNGSNWDFAIVDDNKLIGYVSFYFDCYARSATRFGLMSFDPNSNIKIGYAVRDLIDYIINKLKVHRLEFRAVSGNPVENAYDFMLNKYDGTKLTLRDNTIDVYGKYHDIYIYEFIF